jgi:Ran GTPase-activating protein (RanGAP) involved in mRNA processing and transport
MAVVCFSTKTSLNHTVDADDSSQILASLEEAQGKGTRVIELDIVGLVDDEAIEPLSCAIRQNSTLNDLQVLKLPRNSLTAACCTSLAHILRSTASTLAELDICDNRIGEYRGGASLSRRESSSSICSSHSASSLSRLSGTARPSLTGDGLASLVEALSQPDCKLTTLRLGNNKLGPKSTASLAALIKRGTSIVTLDIANNALGTKTIKALIEPLVHNSTLIKLDLSYNNISDRGASLLSSVLDPNGNTTHSLLRDLNLTYNKIGPAGASSLARALISNRTLQRLDLSLNRIGPEGAESFGPVLRYSHTIRELLLSRNNLGEVGGGVLRLLQGLEETEGTNLTRLDLSWNALTDEAALHMARILSGNSALKNLDLSSNAIGNRGVVALMEALQFDVGLSEINIVGNQADDACVEALAKVLRRPSSAHLALLWERNKISTAGKRRLESAVVFRYHLETWLGRCLQDIEACRVVSLDLEELPLGDEELVALSHHLYKYAPRVKMLKAAAGGDILTHRSVSVLARDVIAPNEVVIERLYLSHTPMKNVGAGALAQSILSNTSIRILSLVSCNITPEGAKMLSNALRRNSHIQILSLQGNDLGDAGAREVWSAVLDKAVPSVLSLNLSACNITDGGMFLPAITKLESLFLADNAITDAGALDLAKACIGCRSLVWLDCSRTRISWKGIQALKLFLPAVCSTWTDIQGDDDAD